jgi:hypothetical protein
MEVNTFKDNVAEGESTVNVIAQMRAQVIQGLIKDAESDIACQKYISASQKLDILKEQVRKLESDFETKV